MICARCNHPDRLHEPNLACGGKTKAKLTKPSHDCNCPGLVKRGERSVAMRPVDQQLVEISAARKLEANESRRRA